MIGEKTPVGEVRPSQLLWTYGPGALIDLPNLSVVTLGIDRWEREPLPADRRSAPACGRAARTRAAGRVPAHAAVPEER